MFIWRSLLQLPENHTAFSSLVDKGTHAAYLSLQKKYPIKSRKLLRVLQRYAQLTAAVHGVRTRVTGFPNPRLIRHCPLSGDCPCLLASTHHVWIVVCADVPEKS